MITYKPVYNANMDLQHIRVFVDHKFSGVIKQVEAALWAYAPKGGKIGTAMPSIALVKKSLESE